MDLVIEPILLVLLFFDIQWVLLQYSGAVASGGNAANGIEPGNGYKYHTFTSPGSPNFTTGGENMY